MNEQHTLLRIAGSGGQRIAAVVERATPSQERRPLVIVAPAFEHSIRNSFLIARYLLEQGFDVLRYDACNHVGMSDGGIADFTLRSALRDIVDVVRFARIQMAPKNLSVVATSLAGRVALRAARSLSGELACIASIACVVNVRSTVAAAAGADVVGDWLEGRTRDPLQTLKVVKNRVKNTFCRDVVEGRWDSLGSTLNDARATCATPFFDVHGELDPWVSTPEVLAFAEACPSVEIAILRGAVHELNAASSRLGLRHLVRNVVRHAQGRTIAVDDVPEPQWDELIAMNKRERMWERAPIETWPVAGIAQ